MLLTIIEAEKVVPWQSAESRKDYAWKPESGEIGWSSQGSGVAHPRRMRRSLTSLSHPTETSNKVRAFYFILVRPLETGVVGHKSYILLFSYSSIFRGQMKFYCFWALNVLWVCSKAQKTSPAAGEKYRLFYHADHSWETVEKFPLLLTWCALQSKVFIKTDSQ